MYVQINTASNYFKCVTSAPCIFQEFRGVCPILSKHFFEKYTFSKSCWQATHIKTACQAWSSWSMYIKVEHAILIAIKLLVLVLVLLLLLLFYYYYYLLLLLLLLLFCLYIKIRKIIPPMTIGCHRLKEFFANFYCPR